MDKFKLETSIQFPFFKINEIVTYSEVKKPSGIAYILLVLISESKTKTDRLANVLENFGVPRSLYYIFADTIRYLMDQDILKSFNFNKSEFNFYKICDFKFTDKGEKIFAEESIPTGINKEMKVALFYDVARKEFSFNLGSNLEAKPLMDCAITPEFMSHFKCEKDAEAFLNLEKGKGIAIKKEEIITKVEQYTEQEYWVGKYDLVMNIDGDEVEIELEDPVLQNFLDAHYNNIIINKAIIYKNKFKFKSTFSENLKFSSYIDLTEKVMIPRELDDVFKQKSKLIITKGNYITSNEYQIISEECINSFDYKVELIQVDMHDSIFAYLPGIFNFNSKFGEIKIPLVLKLRLKQDVLKQVVVPHINKLKEYSEDNFKQIVKLTNITKDIETAESIIKGYFNKDPEINIVRLNEIKTYALLNPSILNIYKTLVQTNYDLYLSGITEDNLDSRLKIASAIPSFLNISKKEVLNKIFKTLKVNNIIKVYETLVSRGFDKSLIVLYLNPIPELINGKIPEEKSLLDFINFNRHIELLKKITGINDYKKYPSDYENINYKEFKESFNSICNLQKNIEFFRSSNIALYKEYDSFLEIFKMIKNYINSLEEALNDPTSIKQVLIDEKILRGDYQFVFLNLSIKLENILKNKYGLDGKLSSMLSKARDYNLIEKSIISDLHKFRENRNAYIHPGDRHIYFTEDDLKRWAKEIFDLGEEKHEPTSND